MLTRPPDTSQRRDRASHAGVARQRRARRSSPPRTRHADIRVRLLHICRLRLLDLFRDTLSAIPWWTRWPGHSTDGYMSHPTAGLDIWARGGTSRQTRHPCACRRRRASCRVPQMCATPPPTRLSRPQQRRQPQARRPLPILPRSTPMSSLPMATTTTRHPLPASSHRRSCRHAWASHYTTSPRSLTSGGTPFRT